jgi:hypothetical protein
MMAQKKINIARGKEVFCLENLMNLRELGKIPSSPWYRKSFARLRI